MYGVPRTWAVQPPCLILAGAEGCSAGLGYLVDNNVRQLHRILFVEEPHALIFLDLAKEIRRLAGEVLKLVGNAVNCQIECWANNQMMSENR